MSTRPADAGHHRSTAHVRRRSELRRRTWNAAHDDCGFSTSVHVLVFLPLTVTMLFAGLQSALWWHTRVQAADIAHQTGAIIAADTPTGDPVAAATQRLDTATNLTDIAVSVTETDELVVVTVSGRVPGIFTGTHISVSVSSATPIEAWEPLP
jgi:hypothetical protein